MRGAIAKGLGALALLALAGCAEPPRPSVVPPPPAPEFAENRTYMVIELGTEDAVGGINALCDVTEAPRYRLRYDRLNWPTCSSRELLFGIPDPDKSFATAGGAEATLPDGRRIQVWRVFDFATGQGAEPLPGRYALAARSVVRNTIEVERTRVPVYRIEPGRIHYLGRIDGLDPAATRDTEAFARAFLAAYPDIPRGRLDLRPVDALDIACDPVSAAGTETPNGFNCTGRRSEARYFPAS